MLDTLLAKVVGTQNERELKRLRPIVSQVNAVEPSVTVLSEEQLRAKTAEFRQRLKPVLDRLDKQMHECSDALDFERAARLRDQIVSVRKAIERQQMVDAKEEDYDAIGIVDDPLEASVQVFNIRRGRVVGRRNNSRRHAQERV